MENFSEIIVKNEENLSIPAIDIKSSNVVEESFN